MKQINSNYNTRGRKTKFFSVVGSNDKIHFTTIMEDVTEREAMIEAGRAFDDYEYVAIVRTMLDMNGTPRNSHWKWCQIKCDRVTKLGRNSPENCTTLSPFCQQVF